MANIDYKILTKHLRTIIANIDMQAGQLTDHIEAWLDGDYAYIRDNSIGLKKDAVIAYEAFLSELSKDEIINHKLGDKVLRDFLENLIVFFKDKTKIDNNAIAKHIKEDLIGLRSSMRTFMAIIPVDNLVLKGTSELKVGKLTFKPFNPSAKDIKHRLRQLILTNTCHSDIEKEDIEKRILKYFESNFKGSHVIAVVYIEAEQSKVAELAYAEVDLSLDLLRCYTHILFPKGTNPYPGLRGSIPASVHPCLMFDEKGEGWSLNMKRYGRMMPYEINPERLSDLNDKYALQVLSKILQADRLSDIQNAILRAVRWIGKGVIMPNIPEQVMYFAIALETLMTGVKDPEPNIGSITDKLAKRLAFLLSDDFESRTRIYSRAKNLYGLRSKVVHSGETDIPIKDVNALELLAINALIKMAKSLDEWQTHQEFIDWVEKRQFS